MVNEERIMKKTAFVPFIVSAFLLLSIAAHAAPPTKLHVQGSAVSATFYSFDPATCVGTTVYVTAFEARQQSAGGPVSADSIFMEVHRANECDFTVVFHANAFVPLAPGELEVQSSGRSATLQKSLLLQDFSGGDPVPVTVDVAWSGTGEPTHTSHHETFRSPEGSFTSRHRAVSREAQATGTFTTGATTLFSQAPSSFATILLSSSGNISRE
jgi:hypothetical protein